MIYPTRLLFWCDALTVNTRLILIKPKHVTNAPLIAHEKVHQAQMGVNGTWTFWRKYLFNKTFRQSCEVEAYQIHIAQGASAITCAMHLSRDYWLGISQADALKLLETP